MNLGSDSARPPAQVRLSGIRLAQSLLNTLERRVSIVSGLGACGQRLSESALGGPNVLKVGIKILTAFQGEKS